MIKILKAFFVAVLGKYITVTLQPSQTQESPEAPEQFSRKIAGDKIVRVDKEFAGFIPVFLEDVRKDIMIMKEALSQDDLETIRDIAHSIKGAGGGYGLTVVSDFGDLLESATKERNIEEMKKCLNELYDYSRYIEIKYE